MKNIHKFIIFAILGVVSAQGATIDDLASPDQSIRDKVAAELRVVFKDTPAAKWTPTLEKIKKGQSKSAILELLGPEVKLEGGAGSGQSHSQSYRLDDEWILVCWFKNDGGILLERKLVRDLRRVGSEPDRNFTGTWVVYYVNGQKSAEIEYRNGKHFGRYMSYYSDGSRATFSIYTAEGVDGDTIGYHSSGSIAYRGQYSAGKEVGTWTWYDENGKITSTKDHPKQ